MAILWLVSNTKHKSPVMSADCMGLVDYPPLFALLKANNSLSKHSHLSNSESCGVSNNFLHYEQWEIVAAFSA